MQKHLLLPNSRTGRGGAFCAQPATRSLYAEDDSTGCRLPAPGSPAVWPKCRRLLYAALEAMHRQETTTECSARATTRGTTSSTLSRAHHGMSSSRPALRMFAALTPLAMPDSASGNAAASRVAA